MRLNHTVEPPKLKCRQAQQLAKDINSQCSECFSDARATKQFGQWVVKIGGGREACYGKTIETVEGGEDLIRIFKNDNQTAAP